ncbi:putative holin-like toxin [Salinibacillus xinjiangensis]|uniref:Putative holin-like toxin n=1 Tax=Salinibacillus xinjiangensis TaxID=1229268 RepID=A0A6G1X499_9BACI|nr:putative holin-like toxin [Salinibacillus xinjiangensis]
MSIFETLMVLFAFGTFLIGLLTLIVTLIKHDRHEK